MPDRKHRTKRMGHAIDSYGTSRGHIPFDPRDGIGGCAGQCSPYFPGIKNPDELLDKGLSLCTLVDAIHDAVENDKPERRGDDT